MAAKSTEEQWRDKYRDMRQKYAKQRLVSDRWKLMFYTERSEVDFLRRNDPTEPNKKREST